MTVTEADKDRMFCVENDTTMKLDPLRHCRWSNSIAGSSYEARRIFFFFTAKPRMNTELSIGFRNVNHCWI